MKKCSPLRRKSKKGQLIQNRQGKEISMLTSIFKRIKVNLLTFCPSVIQTHQLKTMGKVSDTIKLSLQITMTKKSIIIVMWSDTWNVSYIKLRMCNQVRYDPRSYERNLCNCVYRSLKKSGLQRGLNPWPRDTGATVILIFKVARTSFFAQRKITNVRHAWETRTIEAWDLKPKRPKQTLRRAAFFAQDLCCTVGREFCKERRLHFIEKLSSILFIYEKLFQEYTVSSASQISKSVQRTRKVDHGCHRSGNSQGKKILQGQGKVREFHFESGKIYIFEKSQGKVKF